MCGFNVKPPGHYFSIKTDSNSMLANDERVNNSISISPYNSQGWGITAVFK